MTERTLCPNCGSYLVLSSGPGRSYTFRDKTVALPDDFTFMRCSESACGAEWMGNVALKRLAALVNG